MIKKKIICLVLCLGILVMGFVGCGEFEGKEYSDQEISDVLDKASDIISDKTEFQSFMEEQDITLTAKDVQYDMINTLDQSFALEGIAELSDYYNYGYKESMAKLVFVIKVTPTSKDYSESWHLYCDRASFASFFDKLKEENQVHIYAKSMIPAALFQEGQGNMALAESISW